MQPEAPEDPSAQRLLKSWVVLAVGALALSVLAALVLVLARTPGLAHAGLAEAFAPALIVHVNLATLVWFLAFSVVLLSRSVGGAGLPDGLAGWSALVLAATGVAVMAVSPWVAPGPALLSNYFPLVDSAGFIGGLGIFVLGVALALAQQGWRAARSGAVGAGLVRWALLPFAVAAAALLVSLQSLPEVDARLAHELASWAPGHLIQFYYVAAMMLAWVWMASALGWERSGWRGAAAPFAALALPSLLALPVLAMYPLAAPEFRKSFTVLMALGTWAGPLWLLWRWRQGLWRLRATGGAVAAALRGSALLFIAGCLIGAGIRGDNTMVPAHYHGTVGAATLAFIGVAVRMLGLQARARLAAWMVGLYGAGFTLMVASLTWSGWLGAPRKSAYSEDAAQALGYKAAMALHGVGGLLGVTAAAAFVAMALWALRGGAVLPRLELRREAVPGRVRDVRQRALLITVLGVVLLGGLLALQGRGEQLRTAWGGALAWVPAIDRLSHVRERQREEIALRFEQGVAMLHAKQFEYAVTAFRRVLSIDPGMPEARVNLGFALLGLEQFDTARDFFESATRINPMQGNAYYGLALAWEAKGDLELAMGAMRTYLHLAKGQDERHLARARAALWEWEEKRKTPATTGVSPDAKKGRP